MTNAFKAALVSLSLALVAGSLPTNAQTPVPGAAGPGPVEYRIAPGDVIHVAVFQNPDLTVDARVEESGAISYPLLGVVPLAGLGTTAAEALIARQLHDGGFLVSPHVTVTVVQVRGHQVTVLGQVGKPGRLPLEVAASRLSDIIALAGGITATGSDIVVLTGVRNGAAIHREIDLEKLVTSAGSEQDNLTLENGDVIYVPRAPNYYIYGEVQKPGAFRLERNLTVIQALAAGGGLTPKGTLRGLVIHRHAADGSVQVIEPKLDDPVLSGDVIYLREGLF